MYSSETLRDFMVQTLAYYQQNAEAFWEGTKDHDVSQNVHSLLGHLPQGTGHRILDLGCGPGRDLMTFRSLGHQAIGLDGCPNFVEMARANSGCEVWHQDFLALELPADHFDGVFANASLFHVPAQELARVLGELHASLKPGGVLFSSNPRGANQEGMQGGRFGSFMDLHAWADQLEGASFEAITHYYRPEGRPRHEQPWLASLWRKPSGD